MKSKKLISQGIATLLSISLLTVGVMIPSPHASAAKIKLNKTKLKLTVGSTYKLKINKKKVKVKWTSSKKKIASVNSKGKVKAKKVGSTVISATVKGKKYKCKVTVQKAKTTKPSTTPKATAKTNTATKAPTARPTTPAPTPFLIPTPLPVNTPDQPVTSEQPDATSSPAATMEPIDLDQLAQNISLQSEILTNNILITVTNHNTTWVNDVTINYDLYDMENNNIANGYTVLNSMQPEETMYVTIPLSDEVTTIDETISELYPDVSEADEDTKYMDLKDSIEFTAEELAEQDSSLFLDIKNHSKYDTDICYTVFFYDADGQIVDAVANTVNLTAKDQTTESIDVPLTEEDDVTSILSTDYDIIYSAHGTEEIDELTPYIENIQLTPEKTQHTLLVAVKNNNTSWLSSVNLEYHLYDAEDNYLISAESDLLSMKPGETQYITINFDPDTIQDIDLDQSYADINVEPDNGEYKYNTTTMVTATVAPDYEENNFEITITNNSNYDTEGSYVIYFYEDTSKKILIGAQQFTYALWAKGDSETIEITGPVSYDGEDNPIYAKSYSIEIHARHTLQ